MTISEIKELLKTTMEILEFRPTGYWERGYALGVVHGVEASIPEEIVHEVKPFLDKIREISEL